MKRKIIAETGLALFCLVHGAWADNTGTVDAHQASKHWSASATLREFYDDNFLTQDSAHAHATPGTEVTPVLSYQLPGAQTFLQAQYMLNLRFYLSTPSVITVDTNTLQSSTNKADSVSMSHEFTAKVDHRFSSRFRLRIDEDFAYTQDPDFSQVTANNFQRSTLNYIRNSASATVNAMRIMPPLARRVMYAARQRNQNCPRSTMPQNQPAHAATRRL